MAKSLYKEKIVTIPEGCEIKLEDKLFTFVGELGEQTLDLSRFKFTFEIVENTVIIKSWHGNRKKNDLLNTVHSHILNHANGVVTGFRVTIRAIYKHFPIQMLIEEEGKKCLIKNFLGAKVAREFTAKGDSKMVKQENKDYLAVEGVNLKDVSQTAADIVNDCSKRKKNDTRIFLDGIYRVEKGTIIVK